MTPRSGAPLAIGLTLLWLRLWWHQRQVWNSDPELIFGWIMPALVVFFFHERWLGRPQAVGATRSNRGWAWLAFSVGAAAWGAATLFLAAYPLWTLFLWLQAGAVVLLTLGCLGFVGGRRWAWYFAFPFLFSLTALPWPATVQHNLGALLMGSITRIATLLLNEGGIPAVSVGNVIQISRGWVGVEEACSGLRSLQAGFMMALFLGEFHRFRTGRRIALVGVGLLLALVSNLLRTLWLTWQAAQRGPEAVAAWHDAAGYAALAFNAVCLALLAWWWSHPGRNAPAGTSAADSGTTPDWASAKPALWALLATLLVSESAVHLWFSRSSDTAPARHLAGWTIAFPENAPAFHAMDFSPATRAMLACDRIAGATWTTAEGARRAGYVVDWERHRGGLEIARLHNPLVCLPASGARMTADEGFLSLDVAGRKEPFRFARFADEAEEFAVFFTVIEAGNPSPVTLEPGSAMRADWWGKRWRAIRAGRRPGASRLVALALWQLQPGTETDAVRDALRQLVHFEDTPPVGKK